MAQRWSVDSDSSNHGKVGLPDATLSSSKAESTSDMEMFHQLTPLRIVSMDNSKNHPHQKSERCHSERDEIIS
jgi:hypothetical protein